MQKILDKEELLANEAPLLRELKQTIFIYPTDTIYGIGCDATDETLVVKLRDIKQRATMPFSVIAPSKEWIRATCLVDVRAEEWLARLPGPYTLVLKLKERHALAKAVNGGLPTVGVRIPKHWIANVVEKLGIPVVTTSANLSGEPFMTTLEDLNADVKKRVTHILYEGPLAGKPSTIVRLDLDETEIKER